MKTALIALGILNVLTIAYWLWCKRRYRLDKRALEDCDKRSGLWN